MNDFQRLTELLTENGFEFEVEVEDYDLAVYVKVDPPAVELPEELKPFAWSPDQVDRAIWKGNTDKKTFNGANFELALREYAGSIMSSDPETIELEKTLDSIADLPSLDDYQETRRRIWERVCERPEIVRWEAEMEGMY